MIRLHLFRRRIGLPSFFLLPFPSSKPVRYDLVTLYDTMRSRGCSDCRLYDMILSQHSGMISISEPPLLQYLVLGELRSLST